MTPEINAVSTIIFLFSLAAILIWFRLRMRAEQTEIITPEMVPTST